MDCLREMEAFDDYVIAYAQRDGTTMDFSEVEKSMPAASIG